MASLANLVSISCIGRGGVTTICDSQPQIFGMIRTPVNIFVRPADADGYTNPWFTNIPYFTGVTVTRPLVSRIYYSDSSAADVTNQEFYSTFTCSNSSNANLLCAFSALSASVTLSGKGSLTVYSETILWTYKNAKLSQNFPGNISFNIWQPALYVFTASKLALRSLAVNNTTGNPIPWLQQDDNNNCVPRYESASIKASAFWKNPIVSPVATFETDIFPHVQNLMVSENTTVLTYTALGNTINVNKNWPITSEGQGEIFYAAYISLHLYVVILAFMLFIIYTL